MSALVTMNFVEKYIVVLNLSLKMLEIELDTASGMPSLKLSKKDLYFKVTFKLLLLLQS